MMRAISAACGLALTIGAAPAFAATSKAESCGYQADVVAAVRQARLDRVKEVKVPDHVKAGATWPEEYSTAIPLVTPWVYEMKMRDVKANDLAAAWKEMCLSQ
jgi:hypothetical protein